MGALDTALGLLAYMLWVIGLLGVTYAGMGLWGC